MCKSQALAPIFRHCRTYSGDQLYLLAYSDATVAAVAGDFCTARGFGGAGAVKKQELPIYLTVSGSLVTVRMSTNWRNFPLLTGCLSPLLMQAVADQWRTYDPQTQQACQGTTCVAIAVIECYNAGGAPLGLDGNGNVGCGNSGSGNTGSWNSGSNNRGSCNSGEPQRSYGPHLHRVHLAGFCGMGMASDNCQCHRSLPGLTLHQHLGVLQIVLVHHAVT